MANIASIKYQTGHTSSTVTLNASTFSVDAPFLTDGSPGDTTTGYGIPQWSSILGEGAVWSLIDLGSAQTVSKFEFNTTAAGSSVQDYYLNWSNDGITWTSANSGGSNGKTQTITPTSARYWQLAILNGNSTGSYNYTDYRLYDSGGTIFGPPPTGYVPFYQLNTGTQVTSAPALNTFVLAAPNFQDGQIGDIVSYYQATGSTNQWAQVIGLYNLGGPYTLSGYELQYLLTGTTPTVQVFASPDYSTWTNISGAQGQTSMVNSLSTASPLYEYVCVIAGCLAGTARISDFRLFDSLGVTIPPPGGPRIFPLQQFYEKVIATDTFTQNPTQYASRSFIESGLIIDSFNQGSPQPAQNFTETVLSDSFALSPTTFAVRTFVETIVSEALTQPLQFAETVLSETFTRGAATYPRAFTETVLQDVLAYGVAYAARSFTETVISDSFAVGPVTTIPIGTGAYDPNDPFQFLAHALNTLKSLEPHMLPSKLLTFFDDLAASYRAADLAAQSARLAASQIDLSGGDGSTSTVYGTGDEVFNEAVGPALRGAIAYFAPDTVNKNGYSGVYNSIAGWLAGTDGGGYASIDAYLTAQNTPTKYQYLVAPNTAIEYWLYSSKNLMLSPGNVFAPLTTFGTATVGGSGVITFTAGSIINQANNVGAGAQGYTPSLGIACVITTTINGTLVITVTGNGVTSAGVTFTGHTYNITLSSATAGQTISLNPLTSGDRISQVTAIAKSGSPSATAGAFTVNSILERVVS